MFYLSLLFCGLLVPTCCANAATVLSAQEIYAQKHGQVFILQAKNGDQTFTSSSAIALGDNRFASTCDAQTEAGNLVLLNADKTYAVELVQQDNEHNLCIYKSRNLNTAALKRGNQPKVGDRIYAMSNSAEVGISISEGIVAALRERDNDGVAIQFTAPIAPTSNGGGLFNAQGELIGIIQYQQLQGQNVNFAVEPRLLDQIKSARSTPTQTTKKNYLTHAQQLWKKQDYKAVIELCKEWVSAEPNNAIAWASYGYAATYIQDHKTALNAFNTWHQIAPDAPEADVNRVSALLSLNQANDALALAQSFIGRYQEHSGSWNALGWAQLSTQHIDDAERSFERTIQLEPRLIQAHNGLISIARQRNTLSLLQQRLSYVHFLLPENNAITEQLIMSYIALKRSQSALAIVDDYELQNGISAMSLGWRGNIFFGFGALKKALDVYQKSLNLPNVNTAWVKMRMGEIYAQLKMYPAAVQVYREALAALPKDTPQTQTRWLREQLGIALKDAAQFDEAEKIFLTLKQEDEKNPLAWRQLGFIYSYQDQAAAAMKFYQQALAIDINQPQVWLAMIENHHTQGRYDDMQASYQRLRALRPDWADTAYKYFIYPYEGSSCIGTSCF